MKPHNLCCVISSPKSHYFLQSNHLYSSQPFQSIKCHRLLNTNQNKNNIWWHPGEVRPPVWSGFLIPTVTVTIPTMLHIVTKSYLNFFLILSEIWLPVQHSLLFDSRLTPPYFKCLKIIVLISISLTFSLLDSVMGQTDWQLLTESVCFTQILFFHFEPWSLHKFSPFAFCELSACNYVSLFLGNCLTLFSKLLLGRVVLCLLELCFFSNSCNCKLFRVSHKI